MFSRSQRINRGRGPLGLSMAALSVRSFPVIQGQDNDFKRMIFPGQEVIEQGLGRAVPDDPLVDRSNRRKTIAE